MSLNTSISNATIQLCLSMISYVESSPSKAYTFNAIAACAVNAFLTISGTLVNSSVIIAFWKSPVLRNKTPFFLIMVLSLSDLAVSLFVHPFFILITVKQLTGTGDCITKTVYLTVVTLITGFSAEILFVINIERYLAIVYPFFYQRHVTNKKILAVIFVLWALWIQVTIVPFFNTELQTTIITICVTVLCLTTIFVYTRVFQIARQKRRLGPKPSMLSTPLQEDSTLVSSCVKTTPGERQKAKLATFMKDIKLAKMFILIVVCSQTCYLPNVAYHVYLRLRNKAIKTEKSLMVGTWVVLFVTLNSTLNSLIFFWKNSQLRKETLRITKCT